MLFKNQELSNIFNKIADILEIKADNPFRIKAYRRGAVSLANLTQDVKDMTKEELLTIIGIGTDLADKIKEYIDTGKILMYEELKNEIPDSLLTLLSIPGLGPLTVNLLYKKLNIKTIEELEQAVLGHKLEGLLNIKEKTVENIKKGIEMIKQGIGNYPIGKVLPIAYFILERLKQSAPIGKIELAGSIRRFKETVRDIDILVSSNNPEEVIQIFTSLSCVKDVLIRGTIKSTVVLYEGVQVDLRIVPNVSFGAALTYFTGSKRHNIKIREIASKKGLKINEYGIFDKKDSKRIGGDKEEDIYKTLGLQYISPELREDSGEIELAMKGKLPKLVCLSDIKGDLHIHSNWSDGSSSIEELAVLARDFGYEYIAITDHSKSLGIANGLTAERLFEQKKEIQMLNNKFKKIRILSGIEVDIKNNGELDFQDDILKQLDIVIASIHSGFKQSKEQITFRIVSAMKNQNVDIIAHPSGRLIGERPPYEMDMEGVLKVAKDTNTMLEINAHPLRLDLSDIHSRRAKELGVTMVVNSDTHYTQQFEYITYGIGVARRGWLEKKDIFNTLPISKLLRKISPRENDY